MRILGIMLLFASLNTKGQKIEVYDNTNILVNTIEPGTVFYKLKGDKEVYIANFESIRNDSIITSDSKICIESIELVVEQNLINNITFSLGFCCNVGLYPVQFAIPTYILFISRNDYQYKNSEVALYSFVGIYLARKIGQLSMIYGVKLSAIKYRNCTYKLVE